MDDIKKGLVLEGGALRGIFSAGVMDVLLENHIQFDGVIGVSAGATFGANYVSKQQGRVLRYNLRFAHDWRYCSIRSLLLTGDLFGARFDYQELPNNLDVFDNKTYETNPTNFYVVCTDVETGKPIYKRCEAGGVQLFEWCRASASMPIAARVVNIDGYKLLDGGITDSIPLQYFQKIGFQKNIVVLTQPVGFKKRPMKGMPFFRFFLRRYPKAIEALAHRFVMYNEELDYIRQQELLEQALVIAPDSTLPIGRISHDTEKMKLTYQLGRDAALKRMDQVKEFLNYSAFSK